jgi:murein DD-endopeptidase MepM/ murein hydrolase activator NlpD
MIHLRSHRVKLAAGYWCLALLAPIGPSFAQEQLNTTPRVTGITWPSLPPSAPIADSRLRDVNKVLFPVLFPSSFLDSDSFKLVADQLDYTASISLKGASIAFTGTRIASDAPMRHAHVTAPVPLTARPQADKEDIEPPSASASMVRYGAAYMVRVDCEKPKDARCANIRYAEGILAQAELMGGSDAAPTTAPHTPAPAVDAAAPLPDWHPTTPGLLAPGSGQGVKTNVIYSPNIRFPLKDGPAYLNSQVWGVGGTHGKPGSWKDPRNFSYPWRDTFCETRNRDTPACPGGKGHQGVDIRANDPSDAKYVVVAVESGRIASIGKYSIILNGDSGTRYVYLHMKPAHPPVTTGSRVAIGQTIGLVSNEFGGIPTPVHLHFEILQNVNGKGFQHVPPYTSLVKAYERLE